MSAESGSSQRRGPLLVKGAFVSTPSGGRASTLSFQYNPSSLRRTLTPQMTGGEVGDRSEMIRFTGAPIETVTLDIEIDAIDALEMRQSDALAMGIAPQLAALELLAYPASALVVERAARLSNGTIEVASAVAPSVQFVWGAKRVLPVRIGGFQITEEDFDQNLNPIRATIGISLRVLTYSDVAPGLGAYNDYLTYQRSLELMAATIPS